MKTLKLSVLCVMIAAVLTMLAGCGESDSDMSVNPSGAESTEDKDIYDDESDMGENIISTMADNETNAENDGTAEDDGILDDAGNMIDDAGDVVDDAANGIGDMIGDMAGDGSSADNANSTGNSDNAADGNAQ